MSKLISLIRRAPKRFSALVAMAAAAVIVPAAVFAWGPDRPTFDAKHPAPYVTFNSITDNRDVGDERNFVRVRESGVGNYTENVNLQPGKSYDVMVYYHNNASSGLNESGAGIAKDVLLRMQMAANVDAGKSTNISGFITSSNAKPNEVYDTATLNNPTTGTMDLHFVAGSAKVTSNGKVNGATLPDSVFTTGAKLGFDSLNGTLPGCNEYAGYVIFKIKAHQPNFTVSKQVQKEGETGWKESVTAKPGEKVNYLVTYKNTGTTNQNNVVLKDTLPKGTEYVSGTTYVANATNPNGLLIGKNSDTATTTGMNIGNYAPGAAAYVKFTAKVSANDKLPVCGTNKLVNKAEIQTDNGNKSDTADVIVNKECKPVAKYTCDALKVVQVDRTHFKLTTNYTAENATFKSVTYTIKNAAGQTVDTKTSTSTSLNYTQATVGKFTVQAAVTFTVNGSDKTVTSEGCKGAFEVKKEDKDIQVCELATKKIITIKESAFDASKHSKNLEDCKEIVKNIKVCELATKKIVTINEKDFDAKKHSKNLDDCKEIVKNIKVCELETKKIITIDEKNFDSKKHSKNLADCKVTPPTKIEVCDVTTKTIVTINEADFDETKHSKDLSKCEETPVTPPELPQTGAGENIVAVLGLGAIIASLSYYIASRRALNQ